MDARKASEIARSKAYFVFEAENVTSVILEECLYDPGQNVWKVDVSMLMSDAKGAHTGSIHQTRRVFTISNKTGQVVSIKPPSNRSYLSAPMTTTEAIELARTGLFKQYPPPVRGFHVKSAIWDTWNHHWTITFKFRIGDADWLSRRGIDPNAWHKALMDGNGHIYQAPTYLQPSGSTGSTPPQSAPRQITKTGIMNEDEAVSIALAEVRVRYQPDARNEVRIEQCVHEPVRNVWLVEVSMLTNGTSGTPVQSHPRMHMVFTVDDKTGRIARTFGPSYAKPNSKKQSTPLRTIRNSSEAIDKAREGLRRFYAREGITDFRFRSTEWNPQSRQWVVTFSFFSHDLDRITWQGAHPPALNTWVMDEYGYGFKASYPYSPPTHFANRSQGSNTTKGCQLLKI